MMSGLASPARCGNCSRPCGGHSALSLAAVELEIHLRAMLTGGGGVRLRTAGRRFRGERIAKFLDSEQLGKWDSEVAKAKEFLGQKRDS